MPKNGGKTQEQRQIIYLALHRLSWRRGQFCNSLAQSQPANPALVECIAFTPSDAREGDG